MRRSLFAFGLACIAAGLFLAWFVPSAWFSVPVTGAPKLALTVPPQVGISDVARLLQEKGIVASALGYRVYGFIDASATKPKAGRYVVQNGMSYRKLARMFFFGPERDEVEVKIIEGWTLGEEGEAVRALGAPWPDPLAKDWVSDYPFLSDVPTEATLEGYLFPNTYRVWKDQLPHGLIQKQLDAFASRVATIQQEAKKQGRTIHEVVTLASIVEKEVANPEDRKIVAGIFLRRLQEGMPLQSDATVNYITHAGRARPTYADLEAESAYNTYRNRGLPPGPISNPGADALDAVLFPTRTEYRYFLTDANGKSYYARTFEEHIRNRRRAFGE